MRLPTTKSLQCAAEKSGCVLALSTQSLGASTTKPAPVCLYVIKNSTGFRGNFFHVLVHNHLVNVMIGEECGEGVVACDTIPPRYWGLMAEAHTVTVDVGPSAGSPLRRQVAGTGLMQGCVEDPFSGDD